MIYYPLILTFSRREKRRIVVLLWMFFMSGIHQRLAKIPVNPNGTAMMLNIFSIRSDPAPEGEEFTDALPRTPKLRRADWNRRILVVDSRVTGW